MISVINFERGFLKMSSGNDRRQAIISILQGEKNQKKIFRKLVTVIKLRRTKGYLLSNIHVAINLVTVPLGRNYYKHFVIQSQKMFLDFRNSVFFLDEVNIDNLSFSDYPIKIPIRMLPPQYFRKLLPVKQERVITGIEL